MIKIMRTCRERTIVIGIDNKLNFGNLKMNVKKSIGCITLFKKKFAHI